MTQVGQSVVEGDEIVIRVPVGAVIDLAERKYDMQVTDSVAFTAELVDDLSRSSLNLIAEVAGSMVETDGSNAAFCRRRYTLWDADNAVEEGDLSPRRPRSIAAQHRPHARRQQRMDALT